MLRTKCPDHLDVELIETRSKAVEGTFVCCPQCWAETRWDNDCWMHQVWNLVSKFNSIA
jgi:hypothetical protein